MDILIIIIASAAASLITLFSGFGLGTLLTPVFVFFFPVEVAIALTGIVHFFNNIFKLGLLGRHAQWTIVLQFGIPSVIGAFLGAQVLVSLIHSEPLFRYMLAGKQFSVEPVKLIIAVLMIYFAIAEMFPRIQSWKPSKRFFPAGGLLSGFFGGLSGHQGALRSLFLLRYEMQKEQFLSTGIVIACFVDITRLSLYSTQFLAIDVAEHMRIVLIAIVSAFLGAYIGNIALKKVTYLFIQRIVAVLLLFVAIGLGMGVL